MYLDSASTKPISAQMKGYLVECLEVFGNPSSLHSVGKEAKRLIESARTKVANFIGASEDEIIFTSSGSASNTLAIMGYYEAYFEKDIRPNIYYSPIAHKSIQECCNKIGVPLKVDCYGRIDLRHMEETIVPPGLVVIDYANSEIGVIQEVEEIIDIAHRKGCPVYLDCTASISTTPVDVYSLMADMIGFSGHKLGALKGIGILYKRPNITLSPLVRGSQEQGIFGGTENVLGIASLGKAIELLQYKEEIGNSRDYVERYIKQNISRVNIISSGAKRLSNITCLHVRGVNGDELLAALDENDDIQISTGSACNSGNSSPPKTLLEIGLSAKEAKECIRLSFSGEETRTDLEKICNSLYIKIGLIRACKG